MKVLVSGATGLIGTPLTALLKRNGHNIVRLTRSQPGPSETALHWHPLSGVIDAAALEGFDAVVHLAGENIASGRWTAAKKASFRDSRVKGTQNLCIALERLQRPPKVLACASATGFYGSRGDEVLTESSAAGTGFLAELCRDWEQETMRVAERGTRVVSLRIGVVLSPVGGALQKMLFPFKMGVGGVIGSGRQYWSWITLDDAVAAIHHCLTNDAVRGPVNIVSPQPVTNREFPEALGRVLSRPTILPMPAFAARLALGEMADELLLASARVEPARLKETGFVFQNPELIEGLRHVLNRPA